MLLGASRSEGRILKQSKELEYCIIDDLRFQNELDGLMNDECDWIFIKLNISKEIQEKRIKLLYPDNYQDHIKNNKHLLLINTLKDNEQNCLIKNTISIEKEVNTINNNLGNLNLTIIVYGKNSVEKEPYNKIQQLMSLGFYNVYLYSGGIFEWLLLQDIYGFDEFPTTRKELDILKFKPKSGFTLLLEDID